MALLLAAIGIFRLLDRPGAPPHSPGGGHIAFVDVAGWY